MLIEQKPTLVQKPYSLLLGELDGRIYPGLADLLNSVPRSLRIKLENIDRTGQQTNQIGIRYLGEDPEEVAAIELFEHHKHIPKIQLTNIIPLSARASSYWQSLSEQFPERLVKRCNPSDRISSDERYVLAVMNRINPFLRDYWQNLRRLLFGVQSGGWVFANNLIVPEEEHEGLVPFFEEQGLNCQFIRNNTPRWLTKQGYVLSGISLQSSGRQELSVPDWYRNQQLTGPDGNILQLYSTPSGSLL